MFDSYFCPESIGTLRFLENPLVPYKEPLDAHLLRMAKLFARLDQLLEIPERLKLLIMRTILLHDIDEIPLGDETFFVNRGNNHAKDLDNSHAGKKQIKESFPNFFQEYQGLYTSYCLATSLVLAGEMNCEEYASCLSEEKSPPLEVPLLVKLLDRIASNAVILEYGLSLQGEPDYLRDSQKYTLDIIEKVKRLELQAAFADWFKEAVDVLGGFVETQNLLLKRK